MQLVVVHFYAFRTLNILEWAPLLEVLHGLCLYCVAQEHFLQHHELPICTQLVRCHDAFFIPQHHQLNILLLGKAKRLFRERVLLELVILIQHFVEVIFVGFAVHCFLGWVKLEFSHGDPRT